MKMNLKEIVQVFVWMVKNPSKVNQWSEELKNNPNSQEVMNERVLAELKKK